MELVRCVSIRETMPKQITVGKKYWIDPLSEWIDCDGDTYVDVYSEEAKEHKIGTLNKNHFKIIYRYLKYGGSPDVDSTSTYLLKDLIQWCLAQSSHSLASNVLRYIREHDLDCKENLEKEYAIKHEPYNSFAARRAESEYLEYMGYSVECME